MGRRDKQTVCRETGYRDVLEGGVLDGGVLDGGVLDGVFVGLGGPVALTQESRAQDSLERDYGKELPRIAPLSPADALNSFQVADGFRIDQVAAEPRVVDPIAISFDESGRMFVIEMRGYSENGEDNLGRIRLLEDKDGDGQYETSTIFADGLSWPTALIWANRGLYVAAAPDLFYFQDSDGDGTADRKTVVYSGFERSNVQGLVNSFRWGLDNRIHGATSSSGASLSKPVEDAAPLVLRGRDFSFDPLEHSIVPTSGGAQHGLSFNRWGDKFVCSNSDHIQHVTFEDRYVARNPYFAAPGPRKSIAADGPQADVFRASPIEPWRIVRTRLRVQGLVPGPVEGGGTPAGYFTGATGVTIYRGNAWPDKFLDWAIVGDVGSNLIHRKRVESQGVTFEARRVDEESEFVRSSDIWFRPAQFANAPDGGLYVTDMYREVIEHPRSLPPIIKQHLDLTSGRDRGRIYRIVPVDFEQPTLPDLGAVGSLELVEALQHSNGWHRETASRLLYERQDRSVRSALEETLRDGRLPEGRIRAIYALDGLKLLTPEIVLVAMGDSHDRVRQHGIRLSEPFVGDSVEIRERYYHLLSDPSAIVRYQLAFSLGEFQGVRRDQALATLLKSESKSPHFRVAILSSLGEDAGRVIALLAQDPEFRTRPEGRKWLAELAAQVSKQQRPADIAIVLETLRNLSKSDPKTVEVLVSGLSAKPGSALAEQIAAATDGQSEQMLAAVLSKAKAQATNADVEIPRRVEAVHLLRLGDLADVQSALTALLAPHEPSALQEAVVVALADFDHESIPELLTERWASLSPPVRRRAADALFSREAWVAYVFRAVDNGQIAMGDLDAARLRVLSAHDNETIRRQAQQLFDKLQNRDRTKVVELYRPALQLEGDPKRGAMVFKKTCAKCHQVGEMGHPIGPNLAAMRSRGPEAILTNVFDPNREVNPQYLNYALQTVDGRVLTGMIGSETATSVTLIRDEKEQDTILRIDIESLRSTGVSLMPEGLEKELDQQSMADVLAFLESLP